MFSYRSFGKNSLLYLIGNIASGLFGFIYISILTKTFSPGKYGQYSLVITLFNLLFFFLIGWVNQSAVRFYNEYSIQKKEQQYYSSLYVVILLVSSIFFGIAMGIFLIFKNSIDTELKIIILVLIPFFFLESFYNILNSIYRVQNKATRYVINLIIYSSGKVLFTYLLFSFFSKEIYSIFLGNIIIDIILFISCFYFMKRNKMFSFNYSKETITSFLRFGMPLVGMSVTQWVLSTSDRYIIRLFTSNTDVGIYSLAYSLSSNIFNILVVFMLLSSYPLIINVWNEKGKKDTEEFIKSIIRYFFLIIIPIFFGLSAISKSLIGFISSKAYIQGQTTFILVSLGMIFYGLTNYYSKAWELTKKTSILLKSNIVVAILNIGLNFILIPFWGYNMAALTTVIAYSTNLIYLMIKSKKILDIRINIKSTGKIIFSSAIFYGFIKICISIFGDNIVLSIILLTIGFMLYFILLFLLGEIKKETQMIFNFIKKITVKAGYSKQ